jgi:tetratricopeptide (TPR) repeat protein
LTSARDAVNLGLADQPETRATLLGTIGTVYQSLGLYSDSVALLEEGLKSRIRIHGPRDPAVAAALRELGDALCDRGDLAQCETRLTAALDMQRELLGADSLEIAPTIMAQAKLAQLRGDFDAAELLYNQSLEMYRAHGKERTTEATSVMNELAGLYSYRGRHDRAETLYRAALDIDRQALGNDHPQVGQHVHNLAVALHEQGKLDEAAPLYEESMQTLTRVLGEKHPQTIDAAANYGRFLHRRGELARAEEILSKVVELDRQARGPRHAFVAHDLVTLGMVRLDTQQHAQAEKDFRAALDIYAESLPPIIRTSRRR